MRQLYEGLERVSLGDRFAKRQLHPVYPHLGVTQVSDEGGPLR